MKSTNWLIGIGALVIIAGGAYYFAHPSQKDDAMAQEGTMTGETAHDSAVSSSGSMTRDNAMATGTMTTSSDTMTHDTMPASNDATTGASMHQ
ncbi:MAG: hypothetical protein KGI41_00510 [Patescibacteria group bacterium]|nr:hypothetical protein [Patescibacteria group bacterium]MDE1965711.1 hypothetical protein [Patescibacteria group bacterium]